MHYKIAQLSLSPRRNASTTGDVFVAQPDSIKENLAGKLFIIIEIESSTSRDLKIINFLIDNLHHNYYNSEKILLRERINTLKVEHIFEAALAKTNKNFNAFLESNKYILNPNSVNLTVGVIHQGELYLANRGKNKAFLIYKEKNENENNKSYGSIDIFGEPDSKNKTEHDKHDLKKLFSNVISGKIPENGQFIITNEALPEYLSNKQITEITSTLPPVSAAEQIKNTLSKINTYIPFLGIIIKSSKLYQENPQKEFSTRSAQDSIIDLNQTEEKTENLLTPSGAINIKKWFKMPSLLTSKTNPEQNLGLKDKILVKKSFLNFKTFKKIFEFIKNIFIYIINFFFFIFKIISKKQNISKAILKIKETIFLKFKTIKNKFKTIKQKNKILIAVFSVFALLFIINISIQKNHEIKEEKNKKYEKLNVLIEQKQNQAEANLLYSNDKGALKDYEELKDLLGQLPQETEEQIAQHKKFKEKYNQFLEKIRKITEINTEEISNFNNLIKDANPDNIIVSPENNKIYAGDSKQKSIYILDTLNSSATMLAELSKPINSLFYPAKSDSRQIYYYNNKNIINFDIASETLGDLTISLGASKIVSADTYSNRLYLLDAKQGRILRFNRNGNNFSAPYAWNQPNSSLKEGIDMSIDGNIFVLLKNGGVLKFLRGKALDFKLELVDPPLSHPTKILASKDNDFLYILESESSRVVVYNKNGEFQMQYKAKNLDAIKDFQIDENNKIIYFLNDSSVYKAKLTHLDNK